MSAKDPAENLSEFNELRERFQNLADEVSFAAVARDIGDLSETIAALPDEIARLRTRGYVFAKFLEQKSEVLTRHWDSAARQAQMLIQSEALALQAEYQQASNLVNKASMTSSNPKSLASLLPMMEREISDVESRASAAASRIRDSYSTLATDIHQTGAQLIQLHWLLDQRDEATFPFLAGESLFLAAQAEWVVTGKGNKDPDGIVYLTDQRLLFEQKETTGKTLGLFGGKKTQELEWEVPLNQIESVEHENKGLFGGKDMLNFELASGARYPTLTLEIKGGVKSQFWSAQIKRMIAGDTNDERAIAPDAQTVEAMRNAPTACHICGATLPRLVANQNQVTCEYCGAAIRF
ncbi:MAG: hypothetical protein SGI73_10715 [Chloroflexota bacterium]|nr:hypothetical protein [Chloroflexota bacterium]